MKMKNDLNHTYYISLARDECIQENDFFFFLNYYEMQEERKNREFNNRKDKLQMNNKQLNKNFLNWEN